MEQIPIENLLKEVLTTWVYLIQIDHTHVSPNEVILINCIHNLFNCICELLHLSGDNVLDIWKEHKYNIEDTVKYIIDTHFVVVEDTDNIEEDSNIQTDI